MVSTPGFAVNWIGKHMQHWIAFGSIWQMALCKKCTFVKIHWHVAWHFTISFYFLYTRRFSQIRFTSSIQYLSLLSVTHIDSVLSAKSPYQKNWIESKLRKMAEKKSTKTTSGFTKEEELLLNDFSRNVSTKSSALFYGNALIVSAIPICK